MGWPHNTRTCLPVHLLGLDFMRGRKMFSSTEDIPEEDMGESSHSTDVPIALFNLHPAHRMIGLQAWLIKLSTGNGVSGDQ